MKVNIIAHTNAKTPRIDGDLLGTLHVYVNEPPIDGRANAAITTLLAKYLNVNRPQVIMVSGEKSKNKTFEISDNL